MCQEGHTLSVIGTGDRIDVGEPPASGITYHMIEREQLFSQFSRYTTG